jgi:tetratricopeptide (TPR) repeat protein
MQALTSYTNCTTQNQYHTRAWLNKILLLDEIDETRLAVQNARTALEIVKSNMQIEQALATCLGKMGNYTEAERILRNIVEKLTGGHEGSADLDELARTFGNLAVVYHRWHRFVMKIINKIIINKIIINKIIIKLINRLSIAEEYYRKALDLRPHMAHIRQNYDLLNVQR